MERPASLADLDAWSVYGDWLQQHGDRRGELIALDLALPAAPEPAALAAFQALHRELLETSDQLAIVYALGEPRVISVELGELTYASRGIESPLRKTLARASELLENADFLDEVVLAQPFEDHPEAWCDLLAAIPRSCTRVALRCRTLPAADAGELAARLPPSVRHVVVTKERGGYRMPFDPSALVADRFAVLELVGFDFSDPIRGAFARTASLRIRLHELVGHKPSRVEIGEVALFRRGHEALALPRWSLRELIEHYGPLPIRSQLARVLPESYDFVSGRGISIGGRDLVRCGDAWTLRGRPAAQRRIYVDGAIVEPDAVIQLDHGSRIRFYEDGDEWIFLARDATAEIQAAAPPVTR